MKRLVGVLTLLVMLVGLLGLWQPPSAIAANLTTLTLPSSSVLAVEVRNTVDDKRLEQGDKIDLNNTNVRAFLRYPGMYPTIAGMILINAPFDKVEDVLKMPGLTARQREIIEGYIDNFTVTDPESALVEGADRFNNGIYGG